MNAKFSTSIVLAILLSLIMPFQAIAQRITSLTTTAKGQGTVTVSRVAKHKIVAVLVILRENGKAEITLYTDVQLYGQGTWSAGEDLSQGIDLKITGGIVSGNATGAGKLLLRDDAKSIAKLTISASAADGATVTVDFTGDEEKKAPAGKQ